MKSHLNFLTFVLGTVLLSSCGGSAWIIHRDENGGMIGYKNYHTSEDATNGIKKLIPCSNYKVISDDLQTQTSTAIMPMSNTQYTNGNVTDSYGHQYNYQGSTSNTEYVPMNYDTSYRTFTYQCIPDPSQNQTAVSAANQILFQSTDASLNPKIGTVNMQRALQTCDRGKMAKKELESVFNDSKQKLKNEEAELREMSSQANSESEKSSLSAKIENYKNETKAKQTEIQNLEKALTDPILDGLRETIKGVSIQRGYTLIRYSKDGSGADDLTDEVIERFNKASSK